MLYPIIPESSLKVLKVFDLNEENISLESVKNNDFLKTNSSISKIDILFRKIIIKMIDSHCHLDHVPLIDNLKDIVEKI